MYAICHFFNQVFLITPGSIAEQMMSKPAVKAFAPVTIFLLQMQQTLRTPCILSLDARHSPLAHYPLLSAGSSSSNATPLSAILSSPRMEP